MRISSFARTALAGSLTLVGAAAPRLSAQTLGGQVVQIDTKKPLGGAAVALVNDSAQVVASTSASGDGAFYLDAPSAGAYRLVVLVAGASFVSPVVALDSGKTIEKQFSVPDVPESFASAMFARDVTTPATQLPGSPRPVYPAGLAESGTRALVSTMFVVDTDGRPDMKSFRSLNAAADAFVDAIRDALKRTRFVPAEKDGGPVRQVVQYTYDFGLPGDPERGDIIVRPPKTASQTMSAPQSQPQGQSKEAAPRTLYVIGADELSAPGIEQMNLIDALNRLRPKLFGPLGSGTVTTPAEQPVFVNNVRVEGLASLRDITAGNVEEVRYWKHEEAAMKFGMEYHYAITVKLRPDKS
jgi:hypothetical protein